MSFKRRKLCDEASYNLNLQACKIDFVDPGMETAIQSSVLNTRVLAFVVVLIHSCTFILFRAGCLALHKAVHEVFVRRNVNIVSFTSHWVTKRK